MIITIDGPSGTGKTTIGIKLTIKLNKTTKYSFYFIDTGLVYRMYTFKTISSLNHSSINPNKVVIIDKLYKNPNYEKKYSYLYTEEIALKTSELSKVKENRQFITNQIREKVKQIREKQKNSGFVVVGRDCGTVIFPQADFKFYLYTNPHIRAKRRIKQYEKLGIKTEYRQILQQIIRRDLEDSLREESPLPPIQNLPPDFIPIISDNLTITQTVNEILKKIKGIG
ncbi:MAG: (d)CMP kinase [bacterium]